MMRVLTRPALLSLFVLWPVLTGTALAQTGPGSGAMIAPDLPQITDPGATRVIVYSHGTSNSLVREDCWIRHNKPPRTLTSLVDADPHLVLTYLCSQATDGRDPGSYIHKRADEIGAVVDGLTAMGVPAANIYLSGHSAGAWASLMYMSRAADTVAGGILFAPACCGPRYNADRYPIWRGEIRPRQVRQILGGNTLNALVFAYTDDEFNRPRDLVFLPGAYPETITLVSQSCGNGHQTHQIDCDAYGTRARIAAFIGIDPPP